MLEGGGYLLRCFFDSDLKNSIESPKVSLRSTSTDVMYMYVVCMYVYGLKYPVKQINDIIYLRTLQAIF
jgi:hypothetical protein